MKFLIWMSCIVVASILIVAIEKLCEVNLGPLPKTIIAGSAVALAIFICKKRKKK